MEIIMNTTMRRKQAFDAIKTGNLERLKTLVLNKTAANWAMPHRSWALLDEAVNSGRHTIAKWLLSRGANPNTLHSDSCRRGELDKLLRALIPLDMFFSPLASAIEREDARMIRLLLDAGANLSLPTMTVNDRVETCGDMLNDRPSLAAEVEALAIAAGLPVQAAVPGSSKVQMRRSI